MLLQLSCYHYVILLVLWYGYSVGNISKKNSSDFSKIWMR